jgi:hypothetical protein
MNVEVSSFVVIFYGLFYKKEAKDFLRTNSYKCRHIAV